MNKRKRLTKVITAIAIIALSLVALEVTLPDECRLGSDQRSSFYCHRMMSP